MKDYRDYAISGATPAASDAFERALALFQSWRCGSEDELALALTQAPGFTMAHVLNAYLRVCSRDVARVRQAHSLHAQASGLAANARERLHVAAIGAALADDFSAFTAVLTDLLRQYPRDVLALQVAHAFDYLSGDSANLSARVAAVLPAWSKDLPGYHAVLAMHAFGLVECAHYEAAADRAFEALQLDALDARAHHTVAHVYEMTDKPDEGIRWMRDRAGFWASDTLVATHCWWHWALFHLTQGDSAGALALYDQRIRARRSREVSDLIDACALLWRLELAGAHSGTRWQELAAAWAPHITDRYCTFNDIHAMLAFTGARDWGNAQRLESELARRQDSLSRHGETTRLVGLPACRAIVAFGRAEYARATALLGALPAFAHRIGGSHAQRDVLYLTLLEAVQRMRRPAGMAPLLIRRAA
jgi:tetratricopeptide (TPR) repeat protein